MPMEKEYKLLPVVLIFARTGNRTEKRLSKSSVTDPGSGAFDPGSGNRNIFFRIPDLGSRIPNPYFDILTPNFWVKRTIIQGGSDKSEILKIFFKNHIAQLNIIKFF
jgi:hypothetical protein